MLIFHNISGGVHVESLLRFPFALLSFTGSGPFNRCLVANSRR